MAKKVGLREDVPFALNNRGNPDMGIFDFTKMLACTASTRIFAGDVGERPMLVKLVGDALIAPFWPLGTGCNKAILGAHDTGRALQRYASTLAAPGADRRRMHLENLAEQQTILQQLKIVLSGDSKDVKDNRVAGKSPSSAPHFSWKHDPRTRYAKCEASAPVESVVDLYVESWSPPLAGFAADAPAASSEQTEPPLEPMPVDMIDAMASYGTPHALMPPDLERAVSDAGFEGGMPDLERAISGMGFETPEAALDASVVPALPMYPGLPCAPPTGLDHMVTASIPKEIADFLRCNQITSLARLLEVARSGE